MRSLARGSTLNLSAALVSALVNFMLALVVTRGLDQDLAGVFFTSTSLFLLGTTLGQLGSSTGLVYFISGARARGETASIPSYMRAAVGPVLVTAFAVTGIALVLSRPIAELLGQNERTDELQRFVVVLALFVPVAGVTNLAMSATRGLGTMVPSATIGQIFRPALQLVLVSIVVVVGLEGEIAWAWVIPFAPAAGLAWMAWRRRSARLVTEPATRERVSRAFWIFTGPRALASVTQLAMQRLDIILVGSLSGLKDAAVYAAVTRFLVLGGMVSGAVSQAVQPRLGEALGRNDHDATQGLYRTSTAWLMLLSWPIYLMLIIFGPVIVGVFGADYTSGARVLQTVSAAMLVATGCGTVDMVLNMAGRTSWNLGNVLLAFSVNLGLDLLLIPRIGLMGAAIGWAAAIVLANLVPLSQIFWYLRLHPFGAATRTAAALSLLAYAVVPLAVLAVLGLTFAALVVASVLGTLCFAGSVFVARERLKLSDLVKIRRSRRAG